jgi:hypothetical protein
LDYYQHVWLKKPPVSGQPKIKVSEALSPVASFYERLRYTIDYKKEHLLRRNAIERVLKRIIREKGAGDLKLVASELIKELIWAKYIPNNYYPLIKIPEIAAVIDKYLVLGRNYPTEQDWFLAVCSCEIEEKLDPELESINVLAVAIQVWFEERFDWQDETLTGPQKENQLAIAIQRSLFRADEAKSAYYLFRRLGKDRDQAQGLMQIKEDLKNPIQVRLYRFVQKEVVPFQILKTILEAKPDQAGQILADPNAFREEIYQVCEEKYSEIRDRVNRGIIRSIIYIFITKVLIAIAVEVPYEHYFLGRISIFPIASTLAIPLFFVFLIGLTLRKPTEANSEKILEQIFAFVYRQAPEDKIEFSLAKPKKRLRIKAFQIIYWLLFLTVFSLVSFALKRAGFNFVGIGIFFIFLSLVLLFGYRVKFSASELMVAEKKESLASNLLTNISLPFLDLGVWLSDKFAQLNFFIVLFDFLVEAPFKNIIGIIDEWTTYLRERRAEAVETPGEK